MNPARQSERRQRRSIIFWIFLGIAIPAMFFTLSYAAGYRFDERTRSVIQTSALAIHTIPKEALVYLNGVRTEKITPYIENNLMPGGYTIEVRKNGYHAWKKQITFERGLSEIFPEVVLLLDDDAQAAKGTVADGDMNTVLDRTALFGKNSEDLVALPKKYHETYREIGWERPESLMYLPGDRDLLVDQEQQRAYLLDSIDKFSDKETISGAVHHAQWNADELLLYTTEFELWVMADEGKKRMLLTRQSNPILDAAWHPTGSLLFFSDVQGLSAIELDDRDHRQIWKLDGHPSPVDIRVNARGDAVTFVSEGTHYDLQLFE